MVLMNSLCFEREDYEMNPKKSNEEEPIFFDNIYSGYNDWSETPEPVILIDISLNL